MANKLTDMAVTLSFFTVISGLMLANLFTPANELSRSERRQLSPVPPFSRENLFSGALFEELEEYALDQFIWRDTFRSLKAYARIFLFRQADYNGFYFAGGHIHKLDYPLYEQSVIAAAEKFNQIYRRYFPGAKAYYAVIPDKNYFAAAPNGYLSLDYARMLEILQQYLDRMHYIDLFNLLTLEDYYRTDLHWRQDKIVKVANRLLQEMGSEIQASGQPYTRRELDPFYGAYYGQAALKVKPDTLIYLSNSIIEEASVYDHQAKKYCKIYCPENFNNIDPYDIFLNGAKPILTVSNPACSGGKELILFRDSFGSSIAPLLLAGYAQITLIDLRYISTDMLAEYIDFSPGQDVLFLYNTQVLNHSAMLK